MSIVSTIPEKCRRCYACVRECPAKAIKVINGQATVIDEQCIACGNCVKVCTQKAKRIESATLIVTRMLAGGAGSAAANAMSAAAGAVDVPGGLGAAAAAARADVPGGFGADVVAAAARDSSGGDDGPGHDVVAILAPSFPVAFPDTRPGSILTALRRLGFSQVWEVAFGAELIGREYTRLAREAILGERVIVSTPCPAIVSYVSKYMPELVPMLAPIVSPMIATGRAIKETVGRGTRVVFIGPCTAKKAEIKDPEVSDAVDAVLTYEELRVMFMAAGIDPRQEEQTGFDGPSAYLGRMLPISGGLLRAAGFEADILQNAVMVTEGKDRALPALRELADGKSRARVLDVLFCEGCINGPELHTDMSVFARKEMLTDYIVERNLPMSGCDMGEALQPFADVDLSREFTAVPVALPQPTEEEITAALRRMRKYGPEDLLNCGSCGYPSCRDKAVAVCQGIAEPSMCLPYLVEELETNLTSLQKSHRATQDRLVQTERLASMGQISAGVAHEINNPLSTILLYSHMLLKAHREGDAESEDLQMIVREADRCRTIMRGLLDFARQSRVVKAPTDLGRLVRELVDTTNLALADPAWTARVPVAVRAVVEPDLPRMLLDAEQVRQMLVNLVQNGIDAVEETVTGGEVTVSVGLSPSRTLALLRVSDTGAGMSPEVVRDIFTPFYTTKQLGKGTGMGLSIVYGVVKMHAGDISVDSEPGKGTTFLVRIPIGEVNREETHELGKDGAAGG
ncbi:MAG TPA: [Fe-Fe] hydrogenase large subunit C-terminal domain-containing protein [Spirochaetia bacterium]